MALVFLLAFACDSSPSRLPLDAAQPAVTPDAGADANVGPSPITYTSQVLGGQPSNNELVAYQDGDGPWQVVAGDSGVYRLFVASGRYGLLTACELGTLGWTYVTVGYFAVSDGDTRFGMDRCHFSSEVRTVTISGTVTNAPADTLVWVTDGLNREPGTTGTWTMTALPGAGSLMGVVRPIGGSPVGLLLERANYAEGAVFSLDFARMFAAAERDLTLDLFGEGRFMETTYVDETGGQHHIDDGGATATRYRVVPGDRVGNGISLLYEEARLDQSVLSIQRAFKVPVAQILTLPSPVVLPAPPRIATMTPYPIVEATIPKRAGASYYLLSYSSSDAIKMHQWDVTYSAAWLDGTPGADLVSRLPDVSALPGWKATFELGADGRRDWSALIATGPARLMPGAARFGYTGLTSAPFQDGDETSTARLFGLFP